MKVFIFFELKRNDLKALKVKIKKEKYLKAFIRGVLEDFLKKKATKKVAQKMHKINVI